MLLEQDDPEASRRRAVLIEGMLQRLRPGQFPTFHAALQSILGIAYGELPMGDRAANLRRAIACYQQAIGPGRAAFGGVGLEEDAGVGQPLGSGLTGGDEVVEGLTFVGRQRHDVLLQVGAPGGVIAPGEPMRPHPSSL
jgi:hypothetical protein